MRLSIIIGIDLYVVNARKSKINKIKEMDFNHNIDCIVIIDFGVKRNSWNPMLEDRLITGMVFDNKGISKKIIVSVDRVKKCYDEVNVLKDYFSGNNISSKIIFMEHAEFSTYDSIYRAKEIFKVHKIMIVTQEYHLYRDLYWKK